MVRHSKHYTGLVILSFILTYLGGLLHGYKQRKGELHPLLQAPWRKDRIKMVAGDGAAILVYTVVRAIKNLVAP